MSRLLLSTLLVSLTCWCVTVHGWIQLDPITRDFVDSNDGTVRIYHGLNVVFKEPPSGIHTYSLNSEDIANLQSFGFNMVRLGIMWTAVEPVRGEYNFTFLQEARALVDALGEAGIVTLVDMHQDLFSPATCGEGFPSWIAQEAIQWRSCNESFIAEAAHVIGACKSITEFGMRFDSQGNPLPEDCVKHAFSFFYPTPEASTSFQSLYDNAKGIQDAFLQFWNVTSSAFADSEDVIGYDLINEPFVGDLWRDIGEIILPGHTDKKYLQPMYASLNQVIRQNDPEHLLFFESVTLPDDFPLFGGIVSPVGFNSTPGASTGEQFKDVLSYHIYCCLSAPDACDADGNPTHGDVCNKFNLQNVVTRSSDQQRLQAGGFLTEFGACTTGDACVAEIARTTNAADTKLQSWSYWQFKYFDDITTTSGPMEGLYDPSTGQPYADKLKALTRTYAQVVQGIPQTMSFDPTTGAFTLVYTYSNTASQPTMVYFSSSYYPNGPHVLVDTTAVTIMQNINTITFTAVPTLPPGTVIKLTISA